MPEKLQSSVPAKVSCKGEHFSTCRTSCLKSLAALKPDSPKPWASIEDDTNETRELFQENLTKKYVEMVAFNKRYRTKFINPSIIVHMPGIMRVIDLYADVEGLHQWRAERQLCEQVIENWHFWLEDGLPEEDDLFRNLDYTVI